MRRYMKSIYLLAVILGAVLVGSGIEHSFAASEKLQKIDIAELAKDPKFVKALVEYMKKNHPFTQDLVTSMLKDPMLRIQMLGHMSENKDAMKMVNQMMSGNSTIKGMKMDHMSMNDTKMGNMKMGLAMPMKNAKK